MYRHGSLLSHKGTNSDNRFLNELKTTRRDLNSLLIETQRLPPEFLMNPDHWTSKSSSLHPYQSRHNNKNTLQKPSLINKCLTSPVYLFRPPLERGVGGCAFLLGLGWDSIEMSPAGGLLAPGSGGHASPRGLCPLGHGTGGHEQRLLWAIEPRLYSV